MKVKALNKEWTVKPINPAQQQKLYVAFMSCQGNSTVKIDDDKTEVIETDQTIEEKEKMFNLYFKCIDLSGIEELPESLAEKSVLGMAILSEYCGFDKKKLSELESQVG